MSINRFGFDPDNIEIYCMSLVSDAEYNKEQAEEEERRASERRSAIRSIYDSIDRFFKYFEGCKLLTYVAPHEAAEQIIRSLNDVGNVPLSLINEAATDMMVTASADRAPTLTTLINLTKDDSELY